MSLLPKALLVLGALALAACNNPDKYADGMAGGPLGAGAGMGAGMGGMPGGPGDPRSPAYFQQTVGDTVNFMVDQSTLSPQARTTLSGQAQWLMANGAYTAIIEGHADEQGTREYNLALGARRANAAQEFLISQGVAPNRLRTVSYGKERPLAICSTEECYTKNRRAVTVISLGAGS